MKLENAIKGPITSVLGLVIIISTVVSVHMGTIPWVWEGVAGTVVGSIFIFVPDQIRPSLLTAIKSLLAKLRNGS